MGTKSTEMNDSEAEVEFVQYALVTFLKDNVSKVVPIDYVKVDRKQQVNFDPLDCSDFDAKHKYYVHWYHCDKEGSRCDSTECEHEFEVYSDFIKSLGETKESIEQKSEGKRMPAINKKYVSTTETDDEADDSEEVDEVNKLKKVQKDIQNRKKVAGKNRDATVLNKLKKAFELTVFSDSHNKVPNEKNINSQNVNLLKNY